MGDESKSVAENIYIETRYDGLCDVGNKSSPIPIFVE
jgi:hypothetical protein